MRIEPLVLANGFVRLEPLSAEHHGALAAIARQAPEIFRLWPARREGEWFADWLAGLTEAQGEGLALPYAVIPAGSDRAVGHSALLNPDPPPASVEIGATFYAPDAQGTAINPATKRLLLEHAFASGARRVSFNVDARNARSRAAMAKLGAVQEGVLRRNRRNADGHVRDTVVFSILLEEWPGVRDRLDARLANMATAR